MNLQPKYLKVYVIICLLHVLLNHFNTILYSGKYPHARGEGIITPILKDGSPDDC